MQFASDNWAGIAPPIKRALDGAAGGYSPAYGTDPLTQSVGEAFDALFETRTKVFFVATGTAANSLSLGALARPGGLVFCYLDSHIAGDECNAAEFQTGGSKVVGVDGSAGRYDATGLGVAIDAYAGGRVHQGQPAAVSLTQATELGTIHTLEEVAAIAQVARSHGLPVHMDGARFANALVALKVTPAEATWKNGVDLMSFGATKNGCWCADAVVFFNQDLAADFEYLRMRGGHLFSKSRFVAAQFQGYLDGGNWLKLAGHANEMAAKLAAGISKSPTGRLAWGAEANEVFAVWPHEVSKTLRAAGANFHEWTFAGGEREAGLKSGESLLRLITSFATTDQQIERFLAALNAA